MLSNNMDLALPNQAIVNKFIPKNKFFSKAILNTKLKDDFTSEIQKITWKYKLSEDTLWIIKTSKVEEIQIFELELKQQSIPQSVLKVIDKLIPYPILYIFTFDWNIAYGITLKDDSNKKYYFSEWNENIVFDFNWINLERVYENIIKCFIKKTEIENKDFNDIIETDKQIQQLEKDIWALKNKIKTEKQFNKKVALNNELQTKVNELNKLLK